MALLAPTLVTARAGEIIAVTITPASAPKPVIVASAAKTPLEREVESAISSRVEDDPQDFDEKEEHMTTWEYFTTPLIIHNTTAILNNWGEKGWELVQIVTGPEGGLVAYFKRPREES